ncbi:MAG TPA: class I SAM-dependent methyltransferase [Acidimicrobiales bacterium]|jgi:SAM-dependent methyltransferase|nr:class I SAM-dependent methyltransferase [Acidimicrobiales bacterium]
MTEANAAQIEHWNSPDARQWVDQQLEHDRQLEPFGRALLSAAEIGSGSSVLDIGCGCGSTALQAAVVGRVVLGIDISKPMIDRARADAVERGVANVEFLEADVQTHRFAPKSVDIAISRFGVMFFDDPVAAFSNIASSLRRDGRLVFCCWQALARNDWLLLPGMAAAAHLPLPDANVGPGPFSLADPDAVVSLLQTAGFSDVTLESMELPMLVAGGGTVEHALEFLMHTGMARAMFRNADADRAGRARSAVRDVLTEHHQGDGVWLGSACWIVRARRLR